jgi:hypothetical protein
LIYDVNVFQLDGYTEQNMVDPHVRARDAPGTCRLMWFVEPMTWMAGVATAPHGKLHCPKCRHKIGSFSWVCGEFVESTSLYTTFHVDNVQYYFAFVVPG